MVGTKRARRVCARRAPAMLSNQLRQLLLLAALFGFLQARVGARSELILKFLDASCRIDEFQLARVKGMASAANVDLQFRTDAASLERVTTTAGDGRLLVFGMNISLHESSLIDLAG